MVDISKLKQEFKELVKIATDAGFYCDINYFSKSETSINIDKVNTNISKDSDCGVKIRVWDGEKYLEFASSSFEYSTLENNLNLLLEKAKLSKNKLELKIDKTSLEKDFLNTGKDLISLEEKVKDLNLLKTKILEADNDIVNSRVLLIQETEFHLFVNSFKTLYQEIPTNILVTVGFVKCLDGNTRTVYESFVNNSYEKVISKCKSKFNKFKDFILNTKKAKKLSGGKYKVLLAPKLTGLLAHESFGHGMEADTMNKGRALASSMISKKIGNDNINIVDYSNIEGKHGTFHFDHEGNMAKKTYLVKNGIINEPMSDVYSKTYLNLNDSANSRFETFDHKHYVRMSNTYFEPGEENLKDLISKIDDGIFIISSSGGMEDPKGWGVQIQGNFGQRIKDGKLVDEFYDGFTFTGFLPDIVKNISGISKEFDIEGGGNCGKGHKEWVRVSEGGPYLLIDEVILG